MSDSECIDPGPSPFPFLFLASLFLRAFSADFVVTNYFCAFRVIIKRALVSGALFMTSLFFFFLRSGFCPRPFVSVVGSAQSRIRFVTPSLDLASDRECPTFVSSVPIAPVIHFTARVIFPPGRSDFPS